MFDWAKGFYAWMKQKLFTPINAIRVNSEPTETLIPPTLNRAMRRRFGKGRVVRVNPRTGYNYNK